MPPRLSLQSEGLLRYLRWHGINYARVGHFVAYREAQVLTPIGIVVSEFTNTVIVKPFSYYSPDVTVNRDTIIPVFPFVINQIPIPPKGGITAAVATDGVLHYPLVIASSTRFGFSPEHNRSVYYMAAYDVLRFPTELVDTTNYRKVLDFVNKYADGTEYY